MGKFPYNILITAFARVVEAGPYLRELDLVALMLSEDHWCICIRLQLLELGNTMPSSIVILP